MTQHDAQEAKAELEGARKEFSSKLQEIYRESKTAESVLAQKLNEAREQLVNSRERLASSEQDHVRT